MNKTLSIHWNETPLRPISILIVDDNPALGEMTAAMVESLYEARTTIFDSPEKALEAFRRRPDSWDIVITDFNMPIMTGHHLISWIRKLRPELPAVILSGVVSADEACRELAAPVQFVRKPFFIHELRAAMGELIREKQQPTGK